MRLFLLTLLNGLTLAGLYFLLASGFSLIFGLLRYVNMAHGSLLLLAGYVGYLTQERTGGLLLPLLGGMGVAAGLGALLERFVFKPLTGDDMRQTLLTIALSVIMADQMLAWFGPEPYQIGLPEALQGSVTLPWVQRYPLVRLVVLCAAVVCGLALWLVIRKTRLGILIRAGVDDEPMLRSMGIAVDRLFVFVFALGAGLAGLSGVLSGMLFALSPGEDVRYLLGSLMVVVVGGIGSVAGTAAGAVFIGVAEQLGVVYSPTYGPIYMFLVMGLVLAFRPMGLFGRG